MQDPLCKTIIMNTFDGFLLTFILSVVLSPINGTFRGFGIIDAKVFPINNFFHSMFSGIDLYINNKLITNNSDTYPYRAYLENLFSYGSDVKDNQLKAAEF